MKVLKIFWISVVLMGCLSSAYAKKTSVPELRIPDFCNVQIIKTYTGTVVIGRIVEVDSVKVGFETDMGKLTIPVADVCSIEEVPVDALKNGQYWFPNPNATRLFFSPTGRTLKKGEGYFADYYVLFPMAAYGITDWFGIGGGVTLIPFIGLENQVFYVLPRVGIVQSDDFACAAGVLLAKLPYDVTGGFFGAGIAYITGTYGSLDKSLTTGVGYGFTYDRYRDYEGQINSSLEGMEYPILMLGGEGRVGRRISLVTENWIVPDIDESPPLIVSFGVRFFGEDISVDLGFVNPVFTFSYDEGIFPGIPYVDFVYNF